MTEKNNTGVEIKILWVEKNQKINDWGDDYSGLKSNWLP